MKRESICIYTIYIIHVEENERESLSICIEWDLIEWDFPASRNSSMVAKREEFIKMTFN